LFGYDQREIAGEGIAVLLAPESHRDVLGALEAFRVGEDRQHELTEVVGRSRGGDRISLSLTLGRIGQGDGPATCVVIRNASRLKQAEAALSQAKRARDQAGQQATDFLTRISHEIRTPLNAIIGFAEVMLEERLGAVGSERYKSYLTDIRDSGAQVIKLVDDLLDLSKAMAGRTTVPGEGVELNDALMRGVASLQPAAARARVVLRTSFSSGLPPVLIDERSLGQVIDSLLSNAIRFTEAGGQVIASTAMTDQNEVALRIRDTGIGMSHDELEAALEPFRQVSTTRSNEGRGLGLPLARALVEANDGAFAISSEPGEGTLVEILFARSRLDTDHEA
jgi:PAS domain S-box-containing protein